MTQQQPNSAPPGVWDAMFTLVFGRRRAPAPRAPAPQPAPPPAPTNVEAAPPQPAPQAPVNVEAAPPPGDGPVNVEAQPQPAPTTDAAPGPQPAPVDTQPAPQPEPQTAPTEASQPQPIETQPAPQPEPETSAPAPAPIETPAVAAISPFAQRLVDFCVGEWNAFNQGRMRETDEPASSRIAAYWTNVGKDGWSGQTTDQPWSAAFISFAMKEAGDNGRFKKSTGHCIYINDAISRCNDPGAAFHGKRIEDYAPQLGDLICRKRAGSDVTFDSAPNTPWYTSHTDIVSAIKPGEVEMIGGNVSQSVSVRRLPLLPDGRLEPNAAAAAEVFAIMKNNL